MLSSLFLLYVPLSLRKFVIGKEELSKSTLNSITDINFFVKRPLQDLIIRLNTLNYQAFEGNKLIAAIVSFVEFSEFLEDEDKRLFLSNVIGTFFLCLLSKNIQEDVNELLEDMSIATNERCWRFCSKIQQQMQLTIADEESKTGALADVIAIFKTTLTELVSTEMHPFHDFVDGLSTPPGIIPIIKYRLRLLMLHPKPFEIIHVLENLHFPKLHLVHNKDANDYQLNSLVALAWLLNYVPTKNINKCESFVKFKQYLWEQHVRPSISIPRKRIYEIRYKFTDDEILKQLIIFLLPNWQEAWTYFQLPCTFEVQKRLFLLIRDEWAPTAQDYVQLFLKF